MVPGIQRDSGRPPPPAPGASAGTAAVTAAYRRFLKEPGVENEFLTVKALAQRAPLAAQEHERLRSLATAAEVEAGRLSRAHDEDQRRRFSFGTGTAIAAGLAAVDAVPAFLAAQAFGLDLDDCRHHRGAGRRAGGGDVGARAPPRRVAA